MHSAKKKAKIQAFYCCSSSVLYSIETATQQNIRSRHQGKNNIGSYMFFQNAKISSVTNNKRVQYVLKKNLAYQFKKKHFENSNKGYSIS